jgi:glycosyl transferase family 25
MNEDSSRALTLDGVFPYKVCINLDRRPDRWAAMLENFERFGIRSVERLAAIDGKEVILPQRFGHLRAVDYACTLSHLTAVKKARDSDAPSVLIFEDDCLFDPDFVAKFPSYAQQLPADWDMFFLGGYHFEPPVPVYSHVVKAVVTLTAHAYAVRRSVYDDFIELNENPPAIIDRNNTILQKKFNCYCCEPNLVGQSAGYSDLMDEEMPEKPLTYNFPITGNW